MWLISDHVIHLPLPLHILNHQNPTIRSIENARSQAKAKDANKGNHHFPLLGQRPPEPQPTSSHASPHSSDGSTPRGCTGQPAGSPPSPILLRPTSLPPSHNPVTMASPSSFHHHASGCNSPQAGGSAPATTTLPAWAAYLAAPHPVTGKTTATQGRLNPQPGMPSYGNPPTMENIMQMIFDMQTSIGVLSTAVGELAACMNQFIQNRLAPAQAQSVRSTKSMVACPKP